MEIGSRVLVVGGKTGIVRFMGTTEFAQGEWVGVELDTSEGKNDGELNGIRYFACAPNHGLFVKKTQVRVARMSLGPASMSGIPTSSASSSKLQQMRDRRASMAPASGASSTSSSTSRIPAPSRLSLDPARASLLGRKSSSATPSPTSSTSSRIPQGISTSSSIPPPAPVLPKMDDFVAIAELNAVKEKVDALNSELENKTQQIELLEMDLADSKEKLEKLEEIAALNADKENIENLECIEDNKLSPKDAYDIQLRSIRDEGIALASKLREDYEIKVSKLEKRSADVEARLLSINEKQGAEITSLEAELIALRHRNAEFTSSEQGKAEELAHTQAKISATLRKAENLERQVTELQDVIEIMTLEKENIEMDKEIAEERVEECEAEIEKLKTTISLGTETNSDMSNTNNSGDEYLRDENAKLRGAIKALHERGSKEKADMNKKLKEVSKENAELRPYREEVEELVSIEYFKFAHNLPYKPSLCYTRLPKRKILNLK